MPAAAADSVDLARHLLSVEVRAFYRIDCTPYRCLGGEGFLIVEKQFRAGPQTRLRSKAGKPFTYDHLQAPTHNCNVRVMSMHAQVVATEGEKGSTAAQQHMVEQKAAEAAQLREEVKEREQDLKGMQRQVRVGGGKKIPVD
eukprot:scaffold227528_cov18-Tisochrysis_lutea.AAC.1